MCANKWVLQPTVPGDGAVRWNGISPPCHDATVGFAPLISQDWGQWWYKGKPLPKPNWNEGMDELSWGHYGSSLFFSDLRRVAGNRPDRRDRKSSVLAFNRYTADKRKRILSVLASEKTVWPPCFTGLSTAWGVCRNWWCEWHKTRNLNQTCQWSPLIEYTLMHNMCVHCISISYIKKSAHQQSSSDVRERKL